MAEGVFFFPLLSNYIVEKPIVVTPRSGCGFLHVLCGKFIQALVAVVGCLFPICL